jgi:hypothetical protein
VGELGFGGEDAQLGVVDDLFDWLGFGFAGLVLCRALGFGEDRGMDVIASKTESLRPLYVSLNRWILDHDRAKNLL